MLILKSVITLVCVYVTIVLILDYIAVAGNVLITPTKAVAASVFAFIVAWLFLLW